MLVKEGVRRSDYGPVNYSRNNNGEFVIPSQLQLSTVNVLSTNTEEQTNNLYSRKHSEFMDRSLMTIFNELDRQKHDRFSMQALARCSLNTH